MATTEDFIEYVCKQIEQTGAVRYRKMFGEYMVYVNDKPVLTVCDNTVYVKMLPEVQDLLNTAGIGKPYESAKEHYILDIDNQPLSAQVVARLEAVIPVPKPRKRKKDE